MGAGTFAIGLVIFGDLYASIEQLCPLKLSHYYREIHLADQSR